ncbi:MAG: DEAD/DEAH box helicase family protein [Planctomycetales bacterium]|nr:DEAD/DEAH box helicase family protein [Planctomycetales bacterium]
MDESTTLESSPFFRVYDLQTARSQRPSIHPAPHQSEALRALEAWADANDAPSGGILVLPTGGGKTFTACHFLCRKMLSSGFKVLWLAHTHHLLEQAYYGLERLTGLVAEPQRELRARVVSGTIGHFPIRSIQASDDFIVASLQSVSNAVRNNHKSIDDFIASANGKLCVVFDEAHHAPAPSYRGLLEQLRARVANLRLLGLTATPTYTDEKKRGWLKKLFPQGILYQVTPKELMAAGILSRPILEEAATDVEPDFTDRDYDQWVGTHRDLPESIVTSLASNRNRNEVIANCYVAQRERYGKTIIFADRWEQCEQLCEALALRGVRAGAIYSHVDAPTHGVEARRRRTAAENHQVLSDFRNGDLEVLVNIRMATEGTDVPSVQTVFLTRQTTSQILLTQMIGRALRGPRFGGTESAYIVSFIDNWRQRINWASYSQLPDVEADDSTRELGKRPPVRLISIDLVRQLARQLDSGVNINPGPYKSFLPVGWYRVEYFALVAGTDDVEPVSQLILVFEDDVEPLRNLLEYLKTAAPPEFADDTLVLTDVQDWICETRSQFFGKAPQRVGNGLDEDIFSLARHVGQSEGQLPTFFSFDARNDHDLDAIANQHVVMDLGDRAKTAALKAEYTRTDRFWRSIYYTFPLFKSHYDACINRILDADDCDADVNVHRPIFTSPEAIPFAEPSDAIKESVKSRDGFRCLCCGYDKHRSQLQVDHISPAYFGGATCFDNLQTLCRTCNGAEGKGIEDISFRNHQTTLTSAPTRLRLGRMPSGSRAKDPIWWEMFLRRTINLFYRCAAVDYVEIGARGDRLRTWTVDLFPGNDPQWIEPYLRGLLHSIREARENEGYLPAPDTLLVDE